MALVGHFGDAKADQVMTEYDGFATSVANVEMPPWFYAAFNIAGLAPLVKKPDVARTSCGRAQTQTCGPLR